MGSTLTHHCLSSGTGSEVQEADAWLRMSGGCNNVQQLPTKVYLYLYTVYGYTGAPTKHTYVHFTYTYMYTYANIIIKMRIVCAQDLQMEPEQLAEKAATLRAIYEPRYAFPEWTVHELGNGNLMKHAEMDAWPGRLGIGRVGHRELVTRNNSTGHPCLVI